MTQWLVTTWIAIAAFASTNIDDIFVLMAFFADPTYRVKHVVVGQYLGIGALILASLVLALAVMAFPPSYVRLLGLLPLFLGLKGLWELRRNDGEDAVGPAASSKVSKVFGVATVTFANGGDNIGVYVPLFSTRALPQLAAIVLIFLLMTGLWCLVGHYLINHPSLGKPIRSYGRIVLPIVLSALGVFILLGL